jgi:hypothetical protein
MITVYKYWEVPDIKYYSHFYFVAFAGNNKTYVKLNIGYNNEEYNIINK